MSELKTKVKTVSPTVEAEIIENSVPFEAPATVAVEVAKPKGNFINEQGEVNLAVLSESQIEKCRQVTKNLNPKVVGSVSNFGVELQSRLAESGKSFLTTAKTSRSGEVGKIMADLVTTLDKIDVNDVRQPNAVVRMLQKVPVVREFMPSIKKVLIKYETIQDSINTIKAHVEAARIGAMADNNALQHMFDENIEYVKNVETLIVAGTLAIDDAKAELNKLIAEGADPITIQDYQEFVNSLEKKVHDLKAVRQIGKQNLMQIRIIQRNNILTAENANSMITMTVPLFENQMSMAVALAHQSDNQKVMKAVSEKTDALLKANAEMLYKTSVEATEAANRSIVSYDTLMETAEKLKNTISEVKKVQQDAQQRRKEDSAKLAQIEHNIDAIIGTTHQIDSSVKGINLIE